MGKANQQTQMTSDLHIINLKTYFLDINITEFKLSIITESKLVLLTTGQENKLRDKFWEKQQWIYLENKQTKKMVD